MVKQAFTCIRKYTGIVSVIISVILDPGGQGLMIKMGLIAEDMANQALNK